MAEFFAIRLCPQEEADATGDFSGRDEWNCTVGAA